MKKILSLVLLLVLLTISPVLALFCHKCGVELPEGSLFCPACGKPVVGEFQQAPPMPNNSDKTTGSSENNSQQTSNATQSNSSAQTNNSTQTITNTPIKAIEVSASLSTSNYEIVDQIETLLTTSNCNVANIRAEQLTLQHNTRLRSIAREYNNLNQFQKELHNLYGQKLNALQLYLQAWKASENGQNTAKSLADKDKSLFIISHINEAIETLINNGNSLSSLAKAKEIEMRIKKTTKNFVVTSSYLLIDNQRINRGEPIWIIDVVAAEAKVLHMGYGQATQPICGWVSIYDLESRSTWRSDPAFFYSAPASAPQTTVVYETRPTDPIIIYKYPKKIYRYYDYNDRHGRYDHHDYGKNRDKKKKYIRVIPRYW